MGFGVPDRNIRFAGWLALLLACAAAGAGEAPAEGEKPPPRAGEPAEERATPRKTVMTFLEAVTAPGGARIPEAVACMDLSRVEPVDRAAAGPLRAKMLLDILDKTWIVDYEEIAVEAGQEQYRRRLSYNDRTYGAFVLSKQPNGEWLIDAGFVERIPDIYAALEDAAYVEGYSGAADRDLALRLRKLLPASLKSKAFLLEHWQWLGLFLLILSGVILCRIAQAILGGIARRTVTEARFGVSEELRGQFVRPLGTLAMAALYWVGLYFLLLPASINAFLATAAVFFMAFALVQALYRLADLIGAYLQKLADATETKMDDLLVPLIRKTLKIFVVVFGVVFVAGNLGVDVTSMLLGLGIGGVAFAFAAKDTVENFFGSVTVLLDRPFGIGDWVVVNGLEGTVEEVGFRSTRIRTFYNSLVTVPNATFIRANVDNYGARFKRRIKCFVSVTYDTPPEKIEAFCEGIRRLVLEHPYTAKDYYHVYLNQFAASSLDILLYVFVKTPDWATELRERERFFLDVIRLAQRLGVEFAFPTQTLHLGSLPEPGKAWPKEAVEADRVEAREELIRLGAKEAADLARKHAGPGGKVPEPVRFEYHPDDPGSRAGSSGDGE
ncbi:MAG: mechanosensitive ion channel family protein [Planctomycetota bacterium]|nr:mechanosensitive ion channel family protein [Planctomycetota bacterium]